MRFYIDQGAGMESRPYDAHRIASYVQGYGCTRVCLEPKYGWSNQPEIVCFDDTRNLQMYPEYAIFHNWLWENGLTIGLHWNEEV